MTWDRGASHHHLSTVMSLIIYIFSRMTFHFPKRYPLLNGLALLCVTATTLLSSFFKPNLSTYRVTGALINPHVIKHDFIYLILVFTLKLRGNTLRKMLNSITVLEVEPLDFRMFS